MKKGHGKEELVNQKVSDRLTQLIDRIDSETSNKIVVLLKYSPHKPFGFCNLNIYNAGANLSDSKGRPVYLDLFRGDFPIYWKTLDVRAVGIAPILSFSGGYNSPGLCGFFNSKKSHDIRNWY